MTRVQTRRQAAAADGAPVDYGAIEKEFAEHAAALERQAHAIVLQALDIDAPQVTVEGQAYRRVLRCPGKYYTMVGAVKVPRTLYRKVGERIGATVDAISLRAGVVGKGWLPRTASAMAWECQRAPSREAQKASEQWLRLPYSRSAFRERGASGRRAVRTKARSGGKTAHRDSADSRASALCERIHGPGKYSHGRAAPVAAFRIPERRGRLCRQCTSTADGDRIGAL